jgi:D-alanine-D-alanine ligase
MANMPYTGADILGIAICCNKFITKKLLQQGGVPIPNYQMFYEPNEMLDVNLRFPLISKLNEIHGGVEITKEAVSENEKQLRDRLKFLITTYKQPVIVEEFIVGREITAFLLAGKHKKVYLAEKVFNKPDDKFIFATFEDQWLDKEVSEDKSKWAYHYEKFDDPNLREYVKRAFDLTKMAGYAKFDIRMDLSGRYYFIDSNCNPAFGPMELQTAMSYILDLYGISFTEMLRRLMINALKGPIEDISNAQENGKTS